MAKRKPYNAYSFPHGKEIKTFTKGSWQEAEHSRGRQFFEPIPPADRLQRALSTKKSWNTPVK